MSDRPVEFTTHPDRYRHVKFAVDGDTAAVTLDIREDEPFREGYVLKLNSYDLGVDLELADAIERVRFEHPEVRVVVVGSAKDRIFSAGANIKMLGTSTHAFKVNFCKFTNETRLGMEDASAHSGVKFLAALNGVTAGGGYELALACDRIVLVDDGSSAVSLPEVPLLGVLPGTGGLTRVVDKRKVRRDLADVFCTLSEGIKGKRAVDWRLVDALAPRSKFDETVQQHAAELKAQAADRKGPGITWTPVAFTEDGPSRAYAYVTLAVNPGQRTAVLTVRGPAEGEPATPDAFHKRGATAWALQAFRELDAALLHLRFNLPEIGLVALKTEGDLDRVLGVDAFLAGHRKSDWLVNEVVLFQARTLRRLDQTARSFFALVEPGSCFGGSLLELALAADRSYLLEDGEPKLATSGLNAGAYPMAHGLTRLQVRFAAEPARVNEVLEAGVMDPGDAADLGMVTAVLDDIDYEDEVRVAMEERASLSPDALTGMESSLRFPGLETCDSKIFGRLSAWQNWIFFRPNAVGEKGALKLYGHPERPEFDWKRT